MSAAGRRGLSPPRALRVVAGGRATGRGDRPGSRGQVTLVGAGPGDPGLLTLTAVRRLRAADVVYYDALVNHAVLEHARPGARLVDVGKRRGASPVPQAEIEAALAREAQAGRRVVRLKGGDPFVFGRGGEEAVALRRLGIDVEVVPGVSAGIAVPSAAGIPVTHRGLSSSAAFVTAHDLGGGADGIAARRRLGRLARSADTLVVFMAGAHLERLRTTLIDAGLPPTTPAAVIESGTLPAQRAEYGTLDRLEALGAARGGGPVLVVVGATVALAAILAPATPVAAPESAVAAAQVLAAPPSATDRSER
jgi:uroporphyrin-III C-methyltransferase